MGTVSIQDIQALIELAVRANLSQAETLWLRALMARVNEAARMQAQQTPQPQGQAKGESWSDHDAT